MQTFSWGKTVENSNYRLGIDLGTNSLGWCILKLDDEDRPRRIKSAGCRIFSDGRDPKSGSSKAEARRMARGARRRRDRFLGRKGGLMQSLIRLGLMPEGKHDRKKLEKLNPYELRAKAVEAPLDPHELGRALCHLNQRRGFLSNRKTATKEEGKKIKPDIEGLQEALKQTQAKTLGAYLWNRVKEGKLARARTDEKLYPTRSLYISEFKTIRKNQTPRQKISDKDWDELYQKIFYQRPLKPVEPGRCQLNPNEYRALNALPSFQKFRIAQDITNLAWIDATGNKHFLDEGQRKKIWDLLHKQKTVAFGKVRTALKLPQEARFNLEDEKRKDLKGNATAVFLSGKEYFGKKWFDFSGEGQDRIVEDLLNIEKERELIEKAQKEWRVEEDQAKKLAELLPEDFVKGYCRFGITALQKLVPLMRDEGLRYDEAAKKIGYHHSDDRPGKLEDRLEYYGKMLPKDVAFGDPDQTSPEKKYGKIGNPTVHVGLNQLRKVVNEIIETHGRPKEIVVELARELKLSKKQKDELEKEQRKNQKDNERIKEELEKLGLENNGRDRVKYKLWEELDRNDVNNRLCPFSGAKITPTNLFSPEIEIEHILPLSKTLDDSQTNKTLATREANRNKKNRSPYEAFGGNDADYAEILDRARQLPKRKFRRFLPDAMERFDDENEFLARQLNDTRYLSTVAAKYLRHICGEVRVIPGILTAMLRHKLGLNTLLGEHNKKERNDHRHHAIDALVTALTDQGLLQQVSKLTGAGLLEPAEELTDPVKPRLKAPEPWAGFRKEAEEKINQVIVSHKHDHGIEGPLHEDTAYGIIQNPSGWEKENGYNVVRRKPAAELSRNEIAAIRDPHLRKKFMDFAETFESDKDLKMELPEFAGKLGVLRVRVLKKENPIIEIKHSQTPIKSKDSGIRRKGLVPGSVHHLELWKLPDGTLQGEGVNFFEANKKDPLLKRPHPAAKLMLKIHKGDMMRLRHKGEMKTARVVSLSPENKTLWLVEHFESGNLAKRYKEKKLEYIFLSFSKLKESQARIIHVDALGRVKDPGAVL